MLAVAFTRAAHGVQYGIANVRVTLPRAPRDCVRLTFRVAVSESARETAEGNWTGAKYTVLWNGIEIERVAAAEPAVSTKPTVLFIGRHVGFPVALEGALKLKELAYMHAEGFPAGELKHGPIALIEDGLPVVVVMPSPKGRAVLHAKLLSNISEIQARGARTIVIAEEGDETVRPFADHLIEVPTVPTLLQPLVSTVPLQVFAAEIARSRGYDVDKPRNLAKSVTVE